MPKNRTSPIRSGFDYQDLWALKLCGYWLSNPDAYKWIQIEANPTESQFFLDDIVLLGKNNKYLFYQAKFKVEDNYEWTWDDFLKSRKAKKKSVLPSLLKKWATSFINVQNKNVEEITFITNGSVSKEIKAFMLNQKINIQKLKKEMPELYDSIEKEVGDKKTTVDFFNKFKLIFENKQLNDIEKEIVENVFYNSLSATNSGVNNLLSVIKREARKNETIKLSIELIRQWCEFDTPRTLNEAFEIPSDFQFFNEDTHQNILKDLQNIKGGVKILFWKPWTGKSVYLSQLSEILKKQGIVTIKHHYHLNPTEDNPFERLNPERVIEAIKAQFKSNDYKKYLGELTIKDSKWISLMDFISTVVKNSLLDKKSVVIIIDWLDHVIRESEAENLKSFLDSIYYPQKGLWIVFGTQPQVKDEPMFQQIFSKCLPKSRIEIKGLSKNAVTNIIKKNSIRLKLPIDLKIFNEVSNKIFDITKWNPLHLRYILNQLKNTFNNILITEYGCKDLIPYGDNIEDYYNSLWNTLEDNTKSFLLTFIGVGFQFTYKQFIECISSFNALDTNISKNFKKVEHLISFDSRSKLRIYHNSFEVFLFNQSEWIDQKQTIKTNIKNWLEKSNYENLKWAELKKLEHDLGNDDQILSIDRKRLIDAISYPRNSSQIKSQLKFCSKAAFNRNDFAKTLKIEHLNTYYENAIDFVDEASRLIWIESIKLNPEFIDELILSELPADVLVLISNIANEYGKYYIIDEIIEILQERLGFQEYRTWEIPSVTKAILRVIPYDRTHKSKRAYNYIIKFRDLEISPVLFGFYIEKLLDLDQITKVNELLGFNLTEKERIIIIRYCVEYDLKQKKPKFTKIILNHSNNSLLGQVYLILQGEKKLPLPDLLLYNDFPFTIKEYGGDREIWAEKFENLFLIGLIYALSGKQKLIEKSIKITSAWSAQATQVLLKSAFKVAVSMKNHNQIYYKDIFSNLKDIEDLHWPDDRGRLELKYALTDAISNILKAIVLLKWFINDTVIINKIDYKTFVSSSFFKQNDLFKFVLGLNNPILEKTVFQIISDEKTKELSDSIDYFSQRAEDYSNLSLFNFLYKENSKAKELLINAIDNFLGHGYHEDPYLFDVLESIELCAEAGMDSKIINSWIQKIIPIINNIGNCTDGDETRHLPNYLASFLAKYNKNLLFKYYFSEAEKEEFYPAQETFKYVIKSLPFLEEVQIALASTALDKDSLHELEEKAKISEKAKESLKIIQTYLGEICYENDEHSDSHNFQEKEIDYLKITPKKLEEYLKKIETKWDFEKYIVGWTKFWLKKWNKQSIYLLVKKILIQTVNLKSITGELLDILYPLAYEFDNEECFEMLCLAQINDYGWNKYWTDRKKAEARWAFLKEKYPKRYLEFFKKSIDSWFPLSRAVEFFLYFDDIIKAQEITESGVLFSRELMANLNLVDPDWARDDFQNVDEIDLLLQRLVWPSPLVRERSATAIGNLIMMSSQRQVIYERLLLWIKSRRIESIVAIWLLPILKAFQNCTNVKDLSFIRIEKIISSIQVGSIVIDKLLEEISQKTGEKYKQSSVYVQIGEPPVSYQSNPFFIKYIKTILAPIYFSRAMAITKRTDYPFIENWSYTAEVIAKEEKTKLNPNGDFYGHTKNGKFLIGFSTKVSEIYRSAFLRVLYDTYVNWLIPLDFYLEYALATLPVDLSFWKIKSNRMPKWRPKLTNDGTVESKETDLALIKFKEPIENIVQYKQDGNIILGAEGAICPVDGWQKSPSYSFTLIGFGYKVLGKDLPIPEEIAQAIFNIPQTLLIPTSDKPLSFLENPNYLDLHSDAIKIKDLLIFPLITRNRDLTIGLWQYFKDKGSSLNVVDELRSNLKVKIKDHWWIYEDKDDNEIVVFEDWLEGLQERYEFEMPIPKGQQTLINEIFLIKKLKENGLNLWYILETTFRTRKYIYDDIKIVNNFKFLREEEKSSTT